MRFDNLPIVGPITYGSSKGWFELEQVGMTYHEQTDHQSARGSAGGPKLSATDVTVSRWHDDKLSPRLFLLGAEDTVFDATIVFTTAPASPAAEEVRVGLLKAMCKHYTTENFRKEGGDP